MIIPLEHIPPPKSNEFYDIYEKVLNDVRLDAQDAIRLLNSNNLPLIGYLANIVRERLHGNKAYYVYNQHINYTNVCKNDCKFCAFRKDSRDEGAFTLSIEEVLNKVRERLHEPITEIHIVGGLNPDLKFEYYVELIKGIKSLRPEATIKAFTAVEYHHLSEISGKTIEEVLRILVDAGLGAIPGGGAEVFSPEIRRKLCPKKISGERWLEIMEIAHNLGLKSNATMLYGHIESYEDVVDHMLKLRELQDRTGGFLCFIPLPFQSENSRLTVNKRRTPLDDLKLIAVSRLFLDNFPHIKAYWVMLGLRTAQLALNFGADDIDGTLMDERISHDAGAKTPKALTVSQLKSLILEANRIPVERDTFFKVISKDLCKH